MLKTYVKLNVLMISLIISGFSGCNNAKQLPLRVVTEISIGETQIIKLSDGETTELKLIEVKEVRDSLRNALRITSVKITVDGQEATLNTGNYNLPVTVGKVQVDCPVTSGHLRSPEALNGDVQLRLWPAGSPYFSPGKFVYPIKQRWFASMTQTGNEPVYVDWAENVANRNIYYHYGHDIGGAEGMDEVICATDGIVICANMDTLAGYTDFPGDNRTDVVYVVDERNWYYRYSHLDSVDPAIKTGLKVKKGQKIGMIGKQGGSGGWVHLHFQISYKDLLSGNWRTEDAYPYVWEAYVDEFKPEIIAVARPHHLVWAGQEAVLDGRKSRSFAGDIVSWQWQFTDGTSAEGPVTTRQYNLPGEYSEILKVTDSKGNTDFDFAVVQVYDRQNPDKKIPAIQAAYHPSLNIKAGDTVTFLVRTFNTDISNEVWDYGDGTPRDTVKSEKVNIQDPRKGKFAETKHVFSKAGNYIVRVERANENDFVAITHLDVVVKK